MFSKIVELYGFNTLLLDCYKLWTLLWIGGHLLHTMVIAHVCMLAITLCRLGSFCAPRTCRGPWSVAGPINCAAVYAYMAC